MTEPIFNELIPLVGKSKACALMGRSRASFYRSQKPKPISKPRSRVTSERALSSRERQEVLDTLNSERFADMAPEQIYAVLLDEGIYMCSVSTMYRILRENEQVKERRRVARHPAKKKPQLLAARPNEIWSWDITKLPSLVKHVFFDLLVVIDIFSRYVPGWIVVERANGHIASEFLERLFVLHAIPEGTLTVHADRGTEMTSKPVSVLFDDLRITQSHSRPHVSNDNPYSESQFHTTKYHPSYPGQFTNVVDARSWCNEFLDHYNHEHRHSGIGFHTPASMHFGTAQEVREQRKSTLSKAYILHPERFVNKVPTPPKIPTTSWINKPSDTDQPNPQTTRKEPAVR